MPRTSSSCSSPLPSHIIVGNDPKHPPELPCGCLGGSEARNLVVCVDGTSNQFGQKNTNVIELYHQLDKDPTQLTYYNSGIGTYAKPSWKSIKYLKLRANNKVDLAIAWNFENIVIGAYRWLVDNYREGDRIFLFGFSRGAYQVRTLAAMIEKVGLIHKGNEEQIPFAYELYAGYDSSTEAPPQPSTSTDANPRSANPLPKSAALRSATSSGPFPEAQSNGPISAAESFKQTFSRKGVKVHFIGVWDTVSSIGVIRDKNLPGTDAVENISCYFRHALALDERRVKFLPEYAHGGVMLADENDTAQDQAVPVINIPRKPSEAKKAPAQQEMVNPRVKEVWFPGTHSDIGGGNVANDKLDRGHAALLWMSYEANTAGLKTHPSRVDWRWENLSEVHESLSLAWLPMEFLPVKRLDYKGPSSTTWRIHAGRGRVIQPGQKIHASIAFCRHPYRPKAILPPHVGQDWRALIGRGKRSDLQWTQGWEHLLEMDIFNQSTASQCLDMLKGMKNTDIDPSLWLHRLEVMTWSEEGRLTLLSVDDVSLRLLSAMTSFSSLEHRVTASYIVVKLGQLDVLSSFLHNLNIGSELLLKLVLDEPLSKRRLGLSTFLLDDAYFRKQILDRVRVTDEHSISSSTPESELVWTLYMRLSEDFDNESDMLVFQRHACLVLGQLAGHEDSRSKLVYMSIISTLLAKANAETPFPLRCDILMVLGELVKHGEMCELLFELDFLSTLLECLNDEQWHVQELTLSVIFQFGILYGDYSKILPHPIFEAILRMLGSDVTIVQSSALSLALNMLDNDHARQAVINSSALHALLQLPVLMVHGSTILRMAGQIAHYDITALYKLIGPGLISSLARPWAGSYHAKADVINALADISGHDIAKFVGLGPGVILIIHQGIQDNNWFIQSRALWLIQELSQHGVFRRKLLEYETFRLLFEALDSPNIIIQEGAFQSISSLLKYNDIHHKILHSSIIFDLVELSKSNSKTILVKLAVVAELSKYDALRLDIVNSGFLDSLFEENGNLILSKSGNSSKHIHLAALQILLEFARHENSRLSILLHDVFKILFQKLSSKYHAIRASAVACIAELASHVDTHSKLSDEDTISKLLDILQQTTFYTLSAIQTALVLLSQDTLRLALLEMDLLKFLQDKLFNQSSHIIVLSTLSIFAKLTEYGDSRNMLKLDTLVEQLIPLMDHENANIRYQITMLFQSLLKFDDSRQKLLDVDLIFELKWLLRGPSTDIQTALCVHEYTMHEDSREPLLGLNILAELAEMLHADFPELREVAAKSLYQLARDARFLDKFSRLGIENLQAHLHKWLWASESETERQAMQDAYQAITELSAQRRPPPIPIMPEPGLSGAYQTSTQTQTDFLESGRDRYLTKPAIRLRSNEPTTSHKKVSFLVQPPTPADQNFGPQQRQSQSHLRMSDSYIPQANGGEQGFPPYSSLHPDITYLPPPHPLTHMYVPPSKTLSPSEASPELGVAPWNSAPPMTEHSQNHTPADATSLIHIPSPTTTTPSPPISPRLSPTHTALEYWDEHPENGDTAPLDVATISPRHISTDIEEPVATPEDMALQTIIPINEALSPILDGSSPPVSPGVDDFDGKEELPIAAPVTSTTSEPPGELDEGGTGPSDVQRAWEGPEDQDTLDAASASSSTTSLVPTREANAEQPNDEDGESRCIVM